MRPIKLTSVVTSLLAVTAALSFEVIHYCWFGKGPMSDLNKRCIDSWRSIMPDYQIKEWNETNSPLDNRYCKAAYARKLWSRLSNHVRLHALDMEGGIYLDTDVEVIKSFTPLLQHECFIGFQQEEEQVDWLNSAVLAAHRGHQFLGECMELRRKLFAETGAFSRSPMVITMALKAMGLKEYGLQEINDVTVFPAEFFYPFPGSVSFQQIVLPRIHTAFATGNIPGERRSAQSSLAGESWKR